MRFILFSALLLTIGCSSSRQIKPIALIFHRLCKDYLKEQSRPERYFVLYIPESNTSRYTRDQFRKDLIDAIHASRFRKRLIYQDDWVRLFIVPAEHSENLATQENDYRNLLNRFDQGKSGGVDAMRHQLAAYDRFRRLPASEIRKLEPWIQDMIRIPIDYVLIVNTSYQGYPKNRYEYKLTLTLKDIRTGRVEAFSQGSILLKYRLR